MYVGNVLNEIVEINSYVATTHTHIGTNRVLTFRTLLSHAEYIVFTYIHTHTHTHTYIGTNRVLTFRTSEPRRAHHQGSPHIHIHTYIHTNTYTGTNRVLTFRTLLSHAEYITKAVRTARVAAGLSVAENLTTTGQNGAASTSIRWTADDDDEDAAGEDEDMFVDERCLTTEDQATDDQDAEAGPSSAAGGAGGSSSHNRSNHSVSRDADSAKSSHGGKNGGKKVTVEDSNAADEMRMTRAMREGRSLAGAGRAPTDLYIIVHNIEGHALRGKDAQAALAHLAAADGVHMIASMDDVNGGILWDSTKRALFNWTEADLTSFESYGCEMPHSEGGAARAAEDQVCVCVCVCVSVYV
jgi:hypothetical protein